MSEHQFSQRAEDDENSEDSTQAQRHTHAEPRRKSGNRAGSGDRHNSGEGQEAPTPDQCPDCAGRVVTDEAHGERVCTDCGLVVSEETIDPGPEWRAYDGETRNERSRVGSPRTNLMHDHGLSTIVLRQNKDASGNTLSSQQRKKATALRKWNKRLQTRNSSERSLKRGLNEIRRMGSALGLSRHVQEVASTIFRRAVEEDLLPGRSVEGVSSAAVHLGIKRSNAVRTADEIAHVSLVNVNRIFTDSRYLMRQLNLQVTTVDPREYVPQIVSAIWEDVEGGSSHRSADEQESREETGQQSGCLVPSEGTCRTTTQVEESTVTQARVEQTAQNLLQEARSDNYHIGKMPQSIAASAVYLSVLHHGMSVTQKRVADSIDISIRVLRTHAYGMSEITTKQIPEPRWNSILGTDSDGEKEVGSGCR